MIRIIQGIAVSGLCTQQAILPAPRNRVLLLRTVAILGEDSAVETRAMSSNLFLGTGPLPRGQRA